MSQLCSQTVYRTMPQNHLHSVINQSVAAPQDKQKLPEMMKKFQLLCFCEVDKTKAGNKITLLRILDQHL